MQPITEWEHLTKEECLAHPECGEAYSHWLHWPHEYPQVIVAPKPPELTEFQSSMAQFGLSPEVSTLIQNSSAPLVGLLLLLLVAMLIWKLVKMGMDREKNWEESQDRLHGSAREATRDEYEQAGMIGRNASGLLIGAAGEGWNNSLVRYPGSAHLLTFAPTGSGKGVSAIIPNLLEYPGSCLCIDPKGENAAVTARRRRELGQDVFLLDPWNLATKESASFNPVTWLDPESGDFEEDCMMLADTLVIAGAASNNHWDSEAKALIAGVLMFVALHEKPENKHLPRVYELLSQGAEGYEKMIDAMMSSPHDGVRMAGGRQNQKSDREASSVASSALANLHFLGSPRIQAVLKDSDFDLTDLKTKKTTVYLILPAERLSSMSRWLRLMISMSLASFSRNRDTVPEYPVLFLLDEFAALGSLPMVQTAMGLLRGFGVKLWPILQDLSQLKAHYPQAWPSFVANAGAIQVFGTNDPMTAQYFSQMAGHQTVVAGSEGPGGLNTSRTGRLLFQPDEIMRIDGFNQLLFVQQQYPAIVGKALYYRMSEFDGLYDPNPYLNR